MRNMVTTMLLPWLPQGYQGMVDGGEMHRGSSLEECFRNYAEGIMYQLIMRISLNATCMTFLDSLS